MNKEQILEMSRQENKGKDIEKREADIKAGGLATIVSAIFAGIMFFVELFLTDTYNFSLWAVIAVMITVFHLYMFIKLRKKAHMLNAILWGLWSIGLTIAAVSTFITNVA